MTEISSYHAGKAAAFVLLAAVALGALASVIFVDVMGMGRYADERGPVAVGLAAVHIGAVAVAIGLIRARVWARRAGAGIALLLLLAFPIGTLAGGYILFQLFLRWPGGDETDGHA